MQTSYRTWWLRWWRLAFVVGVAVTDVAEGSRTFYPRCASLLTGSLLYTDFTAGRSHMIEIFQRVASVAILVLHKTRSSIKNTFV